jgi:FdhE protein
MTSHIIRESAQALRRIRPAYAELIDFYERIFTAQEDSKPCICIEPISISSEMLALKKREDLPLINASDFAIDIQAATDLLSEICSIAKKSNKIMAEAAQKLSSAIETGTPDTTAFFSMILAKKEDVIEKLAADINIDKTIIRIFGSHSIRPSVEICAQQLSAYLDKEARWDKGYCPICGNAPAFSVLRGDGERFLICDLCQSEWQIRRIFCPFCENTDSGSLSYLYSDEEPEYRVYLCEKCGGYVRTADIRKISRPLYLPLEQISTLHLDMIVKHQET